jgi:RNA polymerase sigma-70 factor, ECF subfamily
MDDTVAHLGGGLVIGDGTLEREFEARLSENLTLAFRVAYSVLRQREDAEDVAQEAFARAHREFRTLRDRTVFRSWLVRITWRLAIDHRRAERRRLAREQAADHPQTTLSAEDSLLADERSRRLWEAVDALPEKLRMVVVLAALEEHGLGDVAEWLGISTGTVKSRLFAAREKLRERLR